MPTASSSVSDASTTAEEGWQLEQGGEDLDRCTRANDEQTAGTPWSVARWTAARTGVEGVLARQVEHKGQSACLWGVRGCGAEGPWQHAALPPAWAAHRQQGTICACSHSKPESERAVASACSMPESTLSVWLAGSSSHAVPPTAATMRLAPRLPPPASPSLSLLLLLLALAPLPLLAGWW